MAKQSSALSVYVIGLAAIVALAGLQSTASAETPPGRPSPGEKPPADAATSRIKVLQPSALKPDIPARLPGATRVRPLSPAEKKAFFNTDTGGAYMTLSAEKLHVPGRGSIALYEPHWVSSVMNVLIFEPPKGALLLTLQGPPKKTYFIDIAFSAHTSGPCEFEIKWPGGATDHMACHGKAKQHLLFGVQTPDSSPGITGGSTWVRITPKQYTHIYQVEVTAR